MAKEIFFPYGKKKLKYVFEEKQLSGVLTSSIEKYKPEFDEFTLVKKALEEPIGSPKLSELSKGKNNIVIIASDHTRPVPSKIIMPLMLEEIRKGNPEAKITILIATGCHRGTTKEELLSKLLGSIQSPIANFARCMNQLAEKGGAAGCPAPAAEEAAPVEEAPAAEPVAEEAPAVEEAPAAEETPAE